MNYVFRIQPALGLGSIFCCLLAATAPHAEAACASGSPQLIIYHAGSLSNEFKALEAVFTTQTGTCVTDVSAGSLDAARQIITGGQPADIFATADFLDNELLLRPAHAISYDIVFAYSPLVLAYTTSSRGAGTIVDSGATFAPPNTIPAVASSWTTILTAPSTLIGGSNPSLDPSGYRADMIFQLAALQAGTPGLYNQLLEHYTTTRTTDAIGTNYDYQITYASSAYAAYQANPTGYRYARLPSSVDLSDLSQELHYAQVSANVPGLTVPAAHVTIPASFSAFGITVLNKAANPAAAVAFLQLLFSAQGTAVQTQVGPTPISSPYVTRADYARLPAALQPLVAQVP